MFMSHVSSRARRAGILALSVAAIGVFAPGASTQSVRFYADDYHLLDVAGIAKDSLQSLDALHLLSLLSLAFFPFLLLF